MKSKEVALDTVKVQLDGAELVEAEKIPFSRKLGWLNKLLWVGSALLVFEYVGTERSCRGSHSLWLHPIPQMRRRYCMKWQPQELQWRFW